MHNRAVVPFALVTVLHNAGFVFVSSVIRSLLDRLLGINESRVRNMPSFLHLFVCNFSLVGLDALIKARREKLKSERKKESSKVDLESFDDDHSYSNLFLVRTSREFRSLAPVVAVFAWHVLLRCLDILSAWYAVHVLDVVSFLQLGPLDYILAKACSVFLSAL